MMGSSKLYYSMDAGFSSLAKEPEQNPRYRRPNLKINNDSRNRLLDIRDVAQTRSDFVGVSRPSEAVDNLLRRRRINHDDAMKNMKLELGNIYTSCENEFRGLSANVKILINNIRKELDEIGDKLGEMNPDEAFEKVKALINGEKKIVEEFYRDLLKIEKKRRDSVAPMLRKYYKIFHKISFLLPYDIQVYLENEILNYNEAVLGNYRTYEDLRLQMKLRADEAKIKFKHLIGELESHRQEAQCDKSLGE